MPDALPSFKASDDPLRERLVAELPGLRSFLRRRVQAGSGVEVDDVVQDVMARALRYLRTFDPARALQPWLRGMAWRVMTDHRARRRTEQMPAEEPEAPPGTGCTPARIELRETLDKVMKTLTPIERSILVRFHGQGESIRTIGASLGMPEGTVKSHLHRARQRLGDAR